jgi:hypothetical protein
MYVASQVRTRILLPLLAIVATLGALLLGAAPSYARSADTPAPTGTTYTFTTLDDQADPTFNQLLGINDNGVIAGYFGSGAVGHPNKGYTLTPPYGQANYTNENFPGSVQTQVTAINQTGQTAGFWVDANGNNFGFIKWEGVFTSYRDPNTGAGTVNQLLGLNDNGIAVGFYTDANGNNHPYSLNRKTGKFTELFVPETISAVATGINDAGVITGFATTPNGLTLGFVGADDQFNGAGFSFPGSNNTMALGINKYDQVVGVYVDNAGAMHGFLASNLGGDRKPIFQTIDDPNGVGTTTINGLNDKGQLVGFYVDGAGNTDGFLATPQPQK